MSLRNQTEQALPGEIQAIQSLQQTYSRGIESSDVTQQQHQQYHIVFSTSCTQQQDWESMVFFYHAHKVRQPGTVTRIISGCKPDEEKAQTEFHQTNIRPLSSNFFVHFTPDFSSIKASKYGKDYKYMNKPYGLKHWIERGPLNGGNPDVENDVIILVDPDMILLRPITHAFDDIENHLWAEEQPLTRTVRHGFPMAMQDGLLTNEWMKFNMTHITGHANYVPNPPRPEGHSRWNAGPPYLATVRDMHQIARKWVEYTPRVLDVFPELYAEMYGFVIATVQLQLPPTLIRSFVVSLPGVGSQSEGWDFVDALSDHDVCDPPSSGAKLPLILHYAQRYRYGPMFFSKYRVKRTIMECSKSLLLPPPDIFVGQFNFSVVTTPLANGKDRNTFKPVHEPIKNPKKARRHAFMICGLTRSINDALLHHKDIACPAGTANLQMTDSVFSDPLDY